MSFAEGAAALDPANALQLDSQAAPARADARDIAASGIAGSGARLPYLTQIQQSFGRHDVTSVQAHTGSRATEASRMLDARGYATGNDVAFAGAPDLHTAAHEAAHIVQQRAGVALKDGVGRSGDRYERHADAVADRVVSGESAESLLDEMAGHGAAAASTAAIQRKESGGPGDKKGGDSGKTSIDIKQKDGSGLGFETDDKGNLTAKKKFTAYKMKPKDVHLPPGNKASPVFVRISGGLFPELAAGVGDTKQHVKAGVTAKFTVELHLGSPYLSAFGGGTAIATAHSSAVYKDGHWVLSHLSGGLNLEFNAGVQALKDKFKFQRNLGKLEILKWQIASWTQGDATPQGMEFKAGKDMETVIEFFREAQQAWEESVSGAGGGVADAFKNFWTYMTGG